MSIGGPIEQWQCSDPTSGYCSTPTVSTGSVGATTAPSNMAVGTASPIPHHPRKAVAPMVRVIVTASSRQVVCQRNNPGGRSSFRAAAG